MFCTKCGSEIAPGARFCARCGSPVAALAGATPSAAPLPVQAAPAISVTAPSPAPTQAPPSCLIYLFGDRFAPRDTALTAGEELPCSGIKVQKKPLTELMLVAALAWLAQNGRITLSVAKKGSLVFKHDAVFVTVARREPTSPGGLEAAILGALTNRLQDDSVEDIVGRVIAETSVDPWGDVIGTTQRSLVELGYFREEQQKALRVFTTLKRVPLCDRIATLGPHLPAVQALLQTWQTSNAAMYRLLHEDVKRGIKSRYEAPESSSSDSFDD